MAPTLVVPSVAEDEQLKEFNNVQNFSNLQIAQYFFKKLLLKYEPNFFFKFEAINVGFFNDCCFFSSVANSVGGEIFQLVLVTMALVKLWSFVWIRAPSLETDLKIQTLASCYGSQEIPNPMLLDVTPSFRPVTVHR